MRVTGANTSNSRRDEMTKRRRPIRDVLAEEAEQAERAYDAGQIKFRRVGRPPKPVRERGQVYSIRIPTERLEEFRRVAAKRNVQAGVLAREWILERLAEESGANVVSMRAKATRAQGAKQTAPRTASKKRAARPAAKKRR